jgi:ribosomal protein L7/L12
VPVLRLIRDHTDYGLKEAKRFIDAAPVVLLRGVAYEAALVFKMALEECGARAEVSGVAPEWVLKQQWGRPNRDTPIV